MREAWFETPDFVKFKLTEAQSILAGPWRLLTEFFVLLVFKLKLHQAKCVQNNARLLSVVVVRRTECTREACVLFELLPHLS